jgi:hypothetical protein
MAHSRTAVTSSSTLATQTHSAPATNCLMGACTRLDSKQQQQLAIGALERTVR